MTTLAVGLALVAIPISSQPQVASKPVPKGARRVWAGRGVDLSGSVSADGRFLTFADWTTGDLALHDLADGENRRLTNKGSWGESDEYAEASVISPDGRQIAYAWFNGKFYDLRLMASYGSDPHVLYRNDDADYIEPGAWSPDRKYVSTTLSLKDSTNRILLVSVADGSARVLKKTDWRWPHLGPFSPDGRYLVFDFPPKRDSFERDVYLLAVNGSGETRLVKHPANDRVLGWASDGQAVLFTRDRGGATEIWAIPVSGHDKSPWLLKTHGERIKPLGLTKEGLLYYGRWAGLRDAYVARLNPLTGRVEGARQPVDEGYLGVNRLPAWSPDGEYLAYLSYRHSLASPENFPLLVIRSLRNNRERELAPALAFEPPSSPLCWSPDGRSIIAAAKDRKSRQGLYRIETQRRRVTPLVLSEPGTREVMPAVAPDGKTVFFLRQDFPDRKSSIVRRNLQTGHEKNLYSEPRPEGINSLALSPDGEQLAFRPGGEHYDVLDVLKVIPAAGGEARDLLRAQVPKGHNISGWAGLVWTPDGKHLLFGRWTGYPDAEQPVTVLRIPVKGGEPQGIGLIMHRIWGLRLHPDGQRLAFTAGNAEPEVWVIENHPVDLQVIDP